MFAAPHGRVFQVCILLALGLITIFLYYYHASIGAHLPTYTGRYGKKLSPANATLGFGGVFVVSGLGSSRRAHLEQAAAVTELNLTIPQQIEWSDDQISNFRIENVAESRVGSGSVKAWLSHHLVLHNFMASGLQTALIIEDDVDWDIRLRTAQIPRAQEAARSLAKADRDWETYPWGTAEDWDLLYLGQCGDYFNDLEEGVGVGHNHPKDLEELPHVLFYDDSMPNRTDLHPFTASLLSALSVPERTRVLHRSKYPLCTFGYAVTREGAHKILTEVAPPFEDPTRNQKAYDVALMAGCRDTSVLNCYSMTPELFHHMEGPSLIGLAEEAENGGIFRPPVDLRGMEQTRWRGETSNIGCGFWSGEFYFDAEPEKLEVLREEVGRKGRCMKLGRENEH